MRQIKYDIQTGAKKIKTKTALLISGATLGLAGLVMAVAMPLGAKAAGPCAVPSVPYPTIQSAASDPTCTTVNVAAGTYTENVTIGHSLTLSGAQAGVDARTRSGAESIINGGATANITITADNVTVDGFTLNGPVSSGTAALVMQTGNTGETIQNNIVNNPGRAASITTSNTTFSKNVVNNTATASDGFQANSTPVHDLNISSNNFGGANGAIYNADITVIEGHSNVVVSGNKATTDGTLIALFKTNGAQITGNTIVGDGASSAIYIGGGDSNVTVSGNQVSSAGSAVKVTNIFGDGANSSVTINRNSLTSNTVFGIFNDPTSGVATLDGTCNWWGAANGPGPVGTGSGDKVSTGVTFAPWLITSNLNGSCIGGNVATNKDQCKDGGWQTLTDNNGRPFKNQGDCVSYVATQGKNKANG